MISYLEEAATPAPGYAEALPVAGIDAPALLGTGLGIGLPAVSVSFGETGRALVCGMSRHAILRRVESLALGVPTLIDLGGEDPARYPLGDLCRDARVRGHGLHLATRGTVAHDWFAHLNLLLLCPEPPSTGLVYDYRTVADCLDARGAETLAAIQVAVASEWDYEFARGVFRTFPQVPHFLVVGTGEATGDMALAIALERGRWLGRRVLGDNLRNVRVLLDQDALLHRYRRDAAPLALGAS